jgi:hypothetical protein
MTPAAPAPAPVVDPRGVGLEEEGSLSPPSNLSRRHTLGCGVWGLGVWGLRAWGFGA